MEQYIKGTIDLDLPEIILSDTEIQVSVEAGKNYSGTIILTNDKKRPMKGVVYSSSRHINVKEEQFIGEEVILHYTIDTQNHEVLDTIEGNIAIISDCGELMIPVKATIIAASLKTGEQILKNLFQFTDLAKEDWATAVSIFKSDAFEDVLLSTEPWRYKEIYRSLLKGRSPSGALEEFLIAIHKKQPIQLSVSKLSFMYESIQEPFLDKINITKDLWGYTEIRVSTDCDFIQLDHNVLWTDDFIGNQYSLQFQIQPEQLGKGKNFGHIYLESALQSFVIEIVCHQNVEKQQQIIDRRKMKKYHSKLLENYLKFRLQKIEFEEYISQSEEVIQSAKTIQEEEFLHLLECHLFIMRGDRLKAKEILEAYENKMNQLKEKSPIIFCAIYYLKALVYQDEVMIQRANGIIHEMYSHGHKDFIIFWFLIYMDRGYTDNRKLLIDHLKQQFEQGCRSPMMYFEAMSAYQVEPALLNELSNFELQVIHFGVKHDFISQDVAGQYAYLAMKERYYNRLTFHALVMMYEKYQSKDILTGICTTLIKGHQRAQRYFKWYKLGVESQLKVTELHEYYMYTIDETSKDPLPQPILLYFIYNSRLNDRKRAYLYARIIKEKASNPSIYRTYAKKMEQFALKQLMSKNINENLSVIYEDLLEQNLLTQEYYPYLQEVAYRTEIICKNPYMKGLFVVHKELEREEYVPLNDNIAYVNVLTDNVMFYFVDAKEQRYSTSVEYEERRLMKETDQLQEILYIINANLYQYVERLAADGASHSYDEVAAALCKQALELPGLKQEYRNALMEQLIYYYNGIHNTDALDYYLKSIDLSRLSRKSRSAILEICIQRENYDQVIEDVKLHGFEDLSPNRLSKLCIRLLQNAEYVVESKLFLYMCLSAFFRGNREEEIIRYLAETFVGATSTMHEIWQAAMSAHLTVHTMEEQLLAQVLFAHGDIRKVQEVFISYYRHSPKSKVNHAYLNYASANYLMKEEQPRIDILGCMKHEVMERKNLFCEIALLKFYSLHLEELIDDEKDFAQNMLEDAVLHQVILPEFVNLEEKLNLPNVMRNKTWIQYKSMCGNHIKLYYRILFSEDQKETEFTSEVMTPTIFGIYVRSFVLFLNETLEYFVTKESDGIEMKTEVQKVYYKPSQKKYNSTFEQLNEMLALYEEVDSSSEELADLIERYVKKDYMIQHYFKTI